MELWIGALNLGFLYSFMAMGVYLTFRIHDFPDITVDGSLTEVDSDGDGVVAIGTDLTNDALAIQGVITTFISSRVVNGHVTPWPSAISLWVDGGIVANQPACNAVAATNPGQITLCSQPYQDETIEYIFISVYDNDATPNLLYSKTLSAN